MKRLLVAALFTIPFAGLASEYRGTVKHVVCHVETVSPVCQVMLNGTPNAETCAKDSSWKYTFDGTTPEGKNILSILMAAQMSGKTVGIRGLDKCTLATGSEDLRHVYIETPM
ncbi:hypothetical protein N474_21095 [Pseudoalteromonas luteoviolacea CPMOR-2]|uniref:Uncharacterized protein n=1 Tax=Pseudoalteromonas luteoviolacea DSM 6061 TaxID=1365250 RepID=A0A166WWY7_9GAMM|nr:hypothetical protein [Pseudoalteromonas luteoviolacea]KZN38765.1 hypothetical protein N475_15310 [Pseudoalteromonas luteoviolacea DSM 6061]KZN53558.1 hypothetical protein N474_21095 [Pseudoalteromonas luteoviolacea CPMOR-2]MBE0387686.1 hypothetical protein [Pseudoalteromonas luteoviolacea DSM 6061]